MSKVNNVIRLPVEKFDLHFFKTWLYFLKPLHKLANREMDVAAFLLKEHFELSSVISDDDILHRNVLSDHTLRKAMKELDISLPHIKVVMSKLKHKKVIVDGKINGKLIPKINQEADSIQLLFLFDKTTKKTFK
jgi:hypothetical protein